MPLSISLSVLGLLVQAVGAGLLTLIFFYLSRGKGNRVLKAAGWGWFFFFLALVSLIVWREARYPFGNAPFQYLQILGFVALIVAADRMDHDSDLGRPLAITALAAAPVAFAIAYFAGGGPLFYAVHTGLNVVGWLVITVLALRSRTEGLGKQFSALLAITTTLLQIVYVLFHAMSAARPEQPYGFLAYSGFFDLFLQMLFGIGLIIWAMEDTERRLSSVHARAVDDTQRTKRRAQLDPLTEAYNRFFLEEIRPTLARDQAAGSIVLIDVDGLKTINDKEGHEEGDKAIWTIAAAIKKLIRGDDYLIRWGGDEFLVILPGMDEELAKKRFYMLPAKIDEVRQAPNIPRAYRKFLAASVGVTPFSARVPFDLAIEGADRVMYERKRALKEMRGSSGRRNRVE
jgi:diguanylate cyclase (GGDEF)-like protein